MHPDCLDSHGQPIKQFTRKADLGRHYKTIHEKRFIDCPRRNCSRKGTNGFTREDHRVEHLRGYHGEVIPKRQKDDLFAYPQRDHLPTDAVSVRDYLDIHLLDDAATVATNTNADQNTRAAEASVAYRDYVHNGEQQYNSNYITARELRDDISEGCGAKNGDCARLEATYGLPAEDQSSGGAEVYAIKKLKTTKAELPLITSLGAATTECAVCEEPLEHTLRGERVLQFSCGHVSHEVCFYEFTKESDSQFCPTCNAPLGLDSNRGGNVLDLGMAFLV
jgi:hypothetical protein